MAFNRQEGVFTLRFNPDFQNRITVAHAEENVQALSTFGNALKGFIAYMPDAYVCVAVVSYYKKNAPNIPMALVADSVFKRMIGSFMLKLGTQNRPVKLFTDDEEAIQWLRTKIGNA